MRKIKKISLKIIPAILEKNIEDLKKKLKKFEKLSNTIQIDVTDGKFVKNRTLNPAELKEIKSKSNLEYHLMVENPYDYISNIKKASLIAIHCEIKNVTKYIEQIRKKKIAVGIAICPQTKIKKLKPFIKKADKILILTVNPGAQGRKFIPSALNKIKQIRNLNKKVKIQIDGGINEEVLPLIKNTGAEEFVVGSALTKSKNIKKQYNLLLSLLKKSS